jgi:hypothetical protein
MGEGGAAAAAGQGRPSGSPDPGAPESTPTRGGGAAAPTLGRRGGGATAWLVERAHPGLVHAAPGVPGRGHAGAAATSGEGGLGNLPCRQPGSRLKGSDRNLPQVI